MISDPKKRIGPRIATPARVGIVGVLLLALAVGYFFVNKLILAPRREAAQVVALVQTTKAGAVTEARRKALANSIAVLPFVNMSPDKDNQFFSDGISEELLNVLARVDGLSVASRTSSFGYRDKALNTQAIGRELNVRHLLQGSVRKTGNTVRITSQLVDAVNDRQLWSKTYDRELTDIFAIQDEIANAIVDALRDTMASSVAAGAVAKVHADTQNMQAYELYLKAREIFLARTDLSESARLFERAVQLDPKFARGWEGLAAVAVVLPTWGIVDRDYLALATHAATRALQLDPSLSMPWGVKGQLAQVTWPVDYGIVFAHFDKAIEADPKNATVYLWRAIILMQLGFFQRSIADTERCLALDPGYYNCTRHKALNLLFLGQEDAAIELFNQGIDGLYLGARPNTFVAPLLARGDRTGALLMLHAMDPVLRRTVLEVLDHPDRPAPDVGKLLAQHPNDPAWGPAPRLALWFGDYDRVSVPDEAGTPAIFPWERYPRSFRNSPGMKRLLRDMGVVAYWRSHGFPPHCRAGIGKDFSCD